MREILFRGKREDSGEWVYGDLIQDKDLDVCMIEYFDYYSSDTGLERDCHQHVIIHETIGQYTGLTDKNGKKVFEGDIVRAYFGNNHSKQTFCVVFDDGMFLFNNGCVKVPKYDIYAMAVIGNIHDNPELLGGADNG